MSLIAPQIIGGSCTFTGIGAPLPGQPPAFTCHCANGSTLVGLSRCSAPPHLLATSYYGACLVNQNHTVSCWGKFYNGDTLDSQHLLPSLVPNLTNVLELSYDSNYNGLCALLLDRRVKCWGYGMLYQDVDSGTPVDANLAGVQQLAVGDAHTCALLVNGDVICWGDNEYYQLGDEFAQKRNVTSPSRVNLKGPAHKIAAAGYHTCAVLEDTSVYCWGEGGDGQLGDGQYVDRFTPVRAQISSVGAKDVATSYYTSCAVLLDGTVQCWGYNGYGDLGLGETTYNAEIPMSLSLTDVKAISGMDYAYCVVLLNTTVQCWGTNYYGQIGAANYGVEIWTPVALPITNVDQIHVNYFHSCARLYNQTVMCWGENFFGQLGDNTTTYHYDPQPVLGL